MEMISEIIVGIIAGVIAGIVSSLLTGFLTGLFGRGVCFVCQDEYERIREEFKKKNRSLDRVIPGGRWKYEHEGGKAFIRRTWWERPCEVRLRKNFGEAELLMWKPDRLKGN
jgi:hypothetical protein